MIIKPNSQNLGNAGEYFISYKLSLHDYVTSITLGRNEGFDILAVSPAGEMFKIQVKTKWEKNKKFWILSKKAEKQVEPNLYYAFIEIIDEAEQEPNFWIIPSAIVAELCTEEHKGYLEAGKKDNTIRIFGIMGQQKVSKYFPTKYLTVIHELKNKVQFIKEKEGRF